MTVPDNAIMRAVVTYEVAQVTKAQNVYHLKHTTGSSQDDEDVLDAVAEWIVSAMENIAVRLSEDVVMGTLELYERVSSLWEPIGVTVPDYTGDHVGELLPAGLAIMVEFSKLRTGYRDRKYLTGFVEDDCQGNGWGAGVRTDVALYAADIIEEFTATNSVKVLAVHYNTTTEVAKEYTGYQVVADVSYQRRRKPGVGLT